MGVSLYTMEHCAVVMVYISVYVSLFAAIYDNGHVCPLNSVMTACSSVMVLASHFVLPYAWRYRNITRGLTRAGIRLAKWNVDSPPLIPVVRGSHVESPA